MSSVSPNAPVACDAMCGGLARWLRLLGVDATYTPGIDDAALVAAALHEGRVVLSSDGRLFERRAFTHDGLRGVHLPPGLRLEAQVRFVAAAMGLTPAAPRCTLCNGLLEPVERVQVGDRVPARSLTWAREFFRCRTCDHVFWDGTHWRRIGRLRDELSSQSPLESRAERRSNDAAYGQGA